MLFETYAKFNQRVTPEVVASLSEMEDPESVGRYDGRPYRFEAGG